MYRFLESIKLKDGVFFRLAYHQERINRCCRQFFTEYKIPGLAAYLHQQEVPEIGLFKCRLLYDEQGFGRLETVPYQLPKIDSLRLVETNLKPVFYKSSDRSIYNQLFTQRADCDDVLLVRNGLLTDTSFANIALFDGKQWVTPRLPVLYGTNRAYLLEKGVIVEQDVEAEKLYLFQKIRLFNAMIEFGEIELHMNKIQFFPK